MSAKYKKALVRAASLVGAFAIACFYNAYRLML